MYSEQCASCRGGQGVEPPALGANPLADCTSDPSGGGGVGTEKREGKRGEGGSLILTPLLFSGNSHPDSER
jgi:hypothetical protein